MLKNTFIHRIAFPTPIRLPPRQDGWYGKLKFGPGDKLPADDTTIRPFQISIPQNSLDDLKQRLNNAKFTDSIEGAEFRYGFNSEALQDVVEYWKNSFSWEKAEKQLNQFNHYKTQIEGIDIHFVHIKPKNPTGVVLPLLVVHGWPGSFYEYYKCFDELVDGSVGGLSFEVIAPSIPGYGFSEAPHQEGFSVISAARIFVKLMERLNMNKFFVHGGDWGSAISKAISVLYPENVRGLHVNLIFKSSPQGVELLKMFAAKFLPMVVFYGDEDGRAIFNDMKNFSGEWFLESGYYHLQSTKPDTVGVALTDSPVGLAAYILEKFSTWTDKNNVYKSDGGLSDKFTLDQLLTNVMIYWLSGNITSSMRFYRENMHTTNGAFYKYSLGQAKVPSSVPVAYAVFPNEIARVPRFLARMDFPNLVQYSVMPRGGHFAAFEEPELVVQDLKKFARKVVVTGR